MLRIAEIASRDSRLHEVHPEVSFRAMNGGEPLRYRKKSAGGAFERLALLRRKGIRVEKLVSTAGAPLDEVLDAERRPGPGTASRKTSPSRYLIHLS